MLGMQARDLTTGTAGLKPSSSDALGRGVSTQSPFLPCFVVPERLHLATSLDLKVLTTDKVYTDILAPVMASWAPGSCVLLFLVSGGAKIS